MQALIKQIHDLGKTKGVVSGNFRIVGDTTLTGISRADDSKANLDQYKAQFDPVIKFFAAGIKVANGPTTKDGFTSADILDATKGACQKKSPLNCALDTKPAVVFIVVGHNDIAAKIPLAQLSTNLTKAVSAAEAVGTIPVLVTITGAPKGANEAQVAQYNQMIYNVAKATQIPLFNLYRVRGENPALIDPATGRLTDRSDKQLDLSPKGLQFGVNVIALHMLDLLSALENAVPLG